MSSSNITASDLTNDLLLAYISSSSERRILEINDILGKQIYDYYDKIHSINNNKEFSNKEFSKELIYCVKSNIVYCIVENLFHSIRFEVWGVDLPSNLSSTNNSSSNTSNTSNTNNINNNLINIFIDEMNGINGILKYIDNCYDNNRDYHCTRGDEKFAAEESLSSSSLSS